MERLSAYNGQVQIFVAVVDDFAGSLIDIDDHGVFNLYHVIGVSFIRDEVLQKIGRNLVNFQKIELMLKYLIANGQVSGYVSEFKQIHENKIECVKKTMGMLVGEFVDSTFQSTNTSPNSRDERQEPYISFSFSVEADSDFYETKKRELKALVDDRNDLIHHLLPRFNTESIESFEEIKKAHAEYFASEEGQKDFELSLLQQSSIVQLLLNVSVQKNRSDGWTFLTTAMQQIRQVLPGEMERLNTRWGYKSLPELMEATELFDLAKENLSNGGYRWMYRPKPALAYASMYRVFQAITDLANRTDNKDGWTSLMAAIQHIEAFFGHDWSEIIQRHSHQSLYAFMLETDQFEWRKFKEGDVDFCHYRLKQG